MSRTALAGDEAVIGVDSTLSAAARKRRDTATEDGGGWLRLDDRDGVKGGSHVCRRDEAENAPLLFFLLFCLVGRGPTSLPFGVFVSPGTKRNGNATR